MKPHPTLLSLIAGVIALSAASPSQSFGQGEVPFDGTDYLQDFNGLNITGNQTLTGKGPHPFSALDTLTITGLEGWYLANPAGSSTNTEFRAQDGSLSGSAGRGIVSFGADASGERALGALATGNQIGVFGLLLKNESAQPIDTLYVSFTGEQWRRGDRTDIPNTLAFAYGLSGSITGPEVTGANASLDFKSLVTSGAPEVALNGNLPANRQFRIGALTGLNWQPGETLALSWTINDISGQDDGLAIDDLKLSLIGPPALEVAVDRPSFLESAPNPAAQGTVTRSGPTTDPLEVSLSSSNTGKATVPATVTIPAGQASASFGISAVDNGILDFDQNVTITASAFDTLPGIFTVSVRDDEIVTEGPLRFELISSVPLDGAEISAYDPASRRIFVTAATGLQALDHSDPYAPVVLTTVDFTQAPFNLSATDVTSTATHGGVVAAAVPNAVKEEKGHVVFLDAATLAHLGTAEVGVLPDCVVFTPDGTKVLTADEGEMLPDGTDPAPGTVSIIDVSSGFANAPVATADFTAFDAQAAALLAAGVRVFEEPGNPGVLKLPSLDFEPEYVAVSADSTKAMVTLQEANAVALLDIETATFTDVVPLGEKDFSGLFADFSDRDGVGGTTAINLTTGNPVFGLYMPDAIASFQAGGQTYYVMANEGDDRDDFLPVDETIRVGAGGYVLDPTAFPDAATLKQQANLGRLVVSNSPGLRGDIDDDGNIERILMLGARSISILDSQGNRVYDSGDVIETFVAGLGVPWFDDTRSDNKGPEPEGVSIGIIDGKTYAFVTLERSRSVMVFDVTDPGSTTMAGFVSLPGDLNPEDVTFIPAAESPLGVPLISVTNERSNTLTTFSVRPEYFTLQLLHLADGEAGLLASQTAPNLAALVDAFDGTYDNTLILSGGDNFIPSPFLNAGTDPSLNAIPSVGRTNFARPDIAIHNLIGVEASAIGNHEWDLGSAVFMDAIRPDGAWVGAQFPHISSNLDYSLDSAANGRFTNVPLDGAATPVPDASAVKSRLVPVAVVAKGGERIGLVGVTTQILRSISSPSGAIAKGFPVGTTGVDDMDLLATHVQPYIDELTAEGVDKIVLLSHLQQLANEQLLATKLSGVDIILAAGSNTRLGDADDVAVAFPGHAATFAGPYPIITSGSDGKPTLIVNTDNEYTYLGRLVVDFDDNGEIILANLPGRVPVNGAYASTAANVAAAWGVAESELAATAFAPGTKGAGVRQITDAVQAVISAKDGDIKGFTSVYLEGERNFVRSEETNLGNLSADANAEALRQIAGNALPVVSLKNGGGIRAQIGSVAVGSGQKLPPAANPSVGKQEGGISQLDIENALRFNNRLMVFDTTPAGLKAILEHGVAAGILQGRFPQVGGVAFAWDPARPAGNRVTSISLIDAEGNLQAAVYRGGFSTWTPPLIRLVTLNFLANGGDGYPVKANGSNFRYLLDDGTLSAPVDPALNFTAAGVLPGNAMGEQQAFSEYLGARHPAPASAYAVADTPAALDQRIQNLSQRMDSVLPFDLTTDTDGDGMTDAEELAYGTNPNAAIRVGDTVDIDLSSLARAGNTLRLAGRLPGGLRFDPATNRITGTVTGRAGSFFVQIQEVNGRDVLRSFSLDLNIASFPALLLGSYQSLLEDESATPLPVGILDLTVTGPGAWSASLRSAGAPSRSARGRFILTEGVSGATLAIPFPARGAAPALNLEAAISAESPLIDGEFTAGAGQGDHRGFRLAQRNALPPANARLTMALDAGAQDGIAAPAGLGSASGSLRRNGTASLRGFLGDARAASFALRLSVTGQAVFWTQPYRDNTSRAGGIAGLGDLGQPLQAPQRLDEGIQWIRSADNRELSYPGGFGPLAVNALASRWTAPRNAAELGASLGLDNLAATVAIEGAGLAGLAPSSLLPTEFTLDNRFNLVATAPADPALVPWRGRANRSSGAWTGSLALPASGDILNRPGAASGVFLQEEAFGATVGAGLVRIPVAGPRGAFRTASLLMEQ